MEGTDEVAVSPGGGKQNMMKKSTKVPNYSCGRLHLGEVKNTAKKPRRHVWEDIAVLDPFWRGEQ